MDAALRAIAEPRRRAILRLVRDEERLAGDIAEAFPDVTHSAISQHLKVLREAGLVEERREGVRRFYRLRPEGLQEVRAFLADFWDDSLTRLKAAAEAFAREQR
ncbi:MAG: helix-turn-helix transcriptional regulator [Myxococcales bacterium]|nr:helix-turn-helix transcriptional regulator [Myxococcales bacterium]MCB9549737.1 helix-turn-helix transcriptional regulator [Myxococcales bacterium]